MNARRQPRAATPASRESLKFTPINGLLLGLGIASAAAGFMLLSRGSTVAAPLLLVLGYVVLIPLGIIK